VHRSGRRASPHLIPPTPQPRCVSGPMVINVRAAQTRAKVRESTAAMTPRRPVRQPGPPSMAPSASADLRITRTFQAAGRAPECAHDLHGCLSSSLAESGAYRCSCGLSADQHESQLVGRVERVRDLNGDIFVPNKVPLPLWPATQPLSWSQRWAVLASVVPVGLTFKIVSQITLYHRLRTRLADELGIDPSPELQTLADPLTPRRRIDRPLRSRRP
jgi:hypothetical protein